MVEPALTGAGPARAGAPGTPETYDVVGIGFGPANLALAVAIEERNAAGDARPLDATFVERRDSFAWHPDMLIEDATMQVSFLKDLATIRDPRSPYSFLCYLQDRGRLVDFVNRKNFFPTRLEYHDYLTWAAARIGFTVRYGSEVTSMAPVHEEGRVVAVDLVYSAPAGAQPPPPIRARNVVLAAGLRPQLPVGVSPSARVFHSASFLSRLAELPPAREPQFVVVGAGQSAAEIVQYLHRSRTDAVVHSVFTRFGYSPADATPFVNRVFDPDSVDDFFHAPQHVKDDVTTMHANTNYSVVEEELITDLYDRAYTEKVSGRHRLMIHNQTAVTHQKDLGDAVAVSLEHLPTGASREMAVDALIYATGYVPVDPDELLGDLSDVVARDERGRVEIERDYRIRCADNADCGVYLQGGETERTHGLGSSLLSNLAVRASDILASIDAPPPRPDAR